MALTILPEKPVALCDVRNWELYANALNKSPLARKYLEGTLRSWVKASGIPNPLVLPWVRALYDGSLPFLEWHLADLEMTLGDSNLEKLLDDLLRKAGPALDLRRDTSSLYGEIVAFRGLREMGAKSILRGRILNRKVSYVSSKISQSCCTVPRRDVSPESVREGRSSPQFVVKPALEFSNRSHRLHQL